VGSTYRYDGGTGIHTELNVIYVLCGWNAHTHRASWFSLSHTSGAMTDTVTSVFSWGLTSHWDSNQVYIQCTQCNFLSVWMNATKDDSAFVTSTASVK
jgi:hypothetical protein